MLCAIFASDAAGGIGLNGSLPWPRCREDMAWFRKNTMGCPVIMGRRTWDSLPGPLPGRKNIVVTHRPLDESRPHMARSVASPAEAVTAATEYDPEMQFVIGGRTIYEALWDRVETVYWSCFYRQYTSDVRFQPVFTAIDWENVGYEEGEQCAFFIYRRRRPCPGK